MEPEVKIDANRSVYVPRVIPLPSSSRKTAFDTSKPWMVVDGKAVLTLLPPLGPFDITVDVSHWSSLDAQSPRASSISMQAGLDTNLTRPSHVVLFDSTWDPQIDNHAVAHNYQIGQTNEVKVYRLICQDSVED